MQWGNDIHCNCGFNYFFLPTPPESSSLQPKDRVKRFLSDLHFSKNSTVLLGDGMSHISHRNPLCPHTQVWTALSPGLCDISVVQVKT